GVGGCRVVAGGGGPAGAVAETDAGAVVGDGVVVGGHGAAVDVDADREALYRRGVALDEHGRVAGAGGAVRVEDADAGAAGHARAGADDRVAVGGERPADGHVEVLRAGVQRALAEDV